MKNIKKIKENGEIFTPIDIVKSILDKIGYFGLTILNKRIMEPSAGTGNFVIEIIKRYIDAAKSDNWNDQMIVDGIDKYIYAIELDLNNYEQLISNINKLFGDIKPKLPNITCNDTILVYEKYMDMFDFVVGNPPYVRIHNLSEITKSNINKLKLIAGMSDLYLAFFEVGFSILNENGKLGFITPNSYLYSSSGNDIKELIVNHCIYLKDFKSYQVFDGATVYAAITILSKQKSENVNVEFIDNNCVKSVSTKSLNDFKLFKNIYINDIVKLTKIKETINTNKEKQYNINIQNGIATNLDEVFIHFNYKENKSFYILDQYKIEKSICRKIIKASTGDVGIVIYPYDANVPIQEDVFKASFPNCYSYLLSNKDKLLKRDLDIKTQWFHFGRSQGINNMLNTKLVINTIAKTNGFSAKKTNKNTVVYSGLFITSDNKKDLSNVLKVLNSEEYKEYASIVGSPKRGGYFQLTSTDLKNFLCIER